MRHRLVCQGWWRWPRHLRWRPHQRRWRRWANFDFTGATEPGLNKTRVQHFDKTTGLVGTTALVSQGGEDQQRLSITLAAGDVFFFKYKTAQPFAMQE